MVEDNETEDELASDFLVATPSDPAANSYCTVSRMYELMKGVSTKLSEKWNALETEEQARLLIEGSRLIDQFRSWGVPKVATQGLSFPRKLDAADVIDPRVERALLEYAKYRVDGKQVAIKNLQKEGISSQNIGGQSATLRSDQTELPAGTKRELLKIARGYFGMGASARKNRSYGCEDRNTTEEGSLFG